MPGQSTNSMLERFRKAKEESKKASKGGGTTLTEGRHLCRLTDAKIIEGDGGKSIKWEWTAVEGDETGEKAIRFSNAKTDEQLMYLLADMRRLEVDVDNLDMGETDSSFWKAIEAELVKLKETAPGARITVKQNGQYTNVYIDRLMDIGDAGAEFVGGGETQEETTAEETGDEAAEGGDAGEPDGGDDDIVVDSKVSFTDAKGKKVKGIVKAVYTDDTMDILVDGAKKPVNVDASKVELLAEVG